MQASGTQQTCLLIGPYPKRMETYRKVIEETVESLGLKTLTIYEVPDVGFSIMEKMRRLIEEADFIIADISGLNPNVMYELGICYALKKSVSIIAEKLESPPPFDVLSQPIILFDKTPQGLEKLRMSLRETLLMLMEPAKNIPVYHKRKKEKINAKKKEFLNSAKQIRELDSGLPKTGATFEFLITRILQTLGFEVISQETKLQDWPVDIVVWGPSDEQFPPELRGLVLVECKNRPLTSMDITRFSALLDSHQLKTGLIVTSARIDDATKERISGESRRHGVSIITLDIDELTSETEREAFIELLSRKITDSALLLRHSDRIRE